MTQPKTSTFAKIGIRWTYDFLSDGMSYAIVKSMNVDFTLLALWASVQQFPGCVIGKAMGTYPEAVHGKTRNHRASLIRRHCMYRI
jgi:hypothetical protein